MLNYIWLSLIIIGILVAIHGDLHDLWTDKYRNDDQLQVVVQPVQTVPGSIQAGQRYQCVVLIAPTDYRAAYRLSLNDTVKQRADLIPSGSGKGSLHVFLDDQSPELFRDIGKGQRGQDYLLAHYEEIDPAGENILNGNVPVMMKFDPVKFVNLNAVTNDGIIKYAKTAVELAIGLIGIMALWLGLMKIAEQSGLVAGLAAILKPITTRIFPDVPHDHPAMGAMIMNISANMLGLANAATPLGIKAMEELNKLNKKAGTATDAMCTFLVINTSNVQLIPATTIAIRAAAGSANPTEILGPVIVATLLTLIIGVTTAKLLARLPLFRGQS